MMTSSYTTIQAFALDVQMSVDNLIKQFLHIGITKNKFDFVTETEKEMLFKYLGNSNIAVFNKFSLQRKTRSTLNISSISGKNKKINVEFRKKKVYMVQQCLEGGVNSLNPDDLVKKGCSNKYELNSNQINSFIKSKVLVNSEKNKIEDIISSGAVEQKDIFKSYAIKFKHSLEGKRYCKTHEESKEVIDVDSKQKLNEKENCCSSISPNIFPVHINKKNDSNIINKSNNLSVLMNRKDSNFKSEYDKRSYNTRMRLRNKNSIKAIKQKKYSHSYAYMNMTNFSYKEDKKINVSSRVNKNKRKSSSLIQSFSKPVDVVSRNIVIGDSISVAELSSKISVKSSYMIKVMMKLGLTATINQILDQETAQLLIEELGHNAVLYSKNALEDSIMKDDYLFNKTSLISNNVQNSVIYRNRAPIVTMMGHVDHGKTSLLNYIRSTKVVSSESGGITQKIGAYCVTTDNGMITFLDTPGHEAFINMRVRGAQLTDIVVLVVAADDGVMPQTIEAINHIRNVNVPVIVAINKIDKSQINVERIKHELNNYGLIPEEWGGNTQFISVSAISGKGINDLLDAILLQSEVLELKEEINSYRGARAVVIDSTLDKSRGPVVTVLVRRGELKCGDIILCGTEYGRVRAMKDVFGCTISMAGSSVPVELLGLSGTPDPGDIMIVVFDEKKAKEVACYRKEKKREFKLNVYKSEKITIKNVFDNVSFITKIPELNFIVKSDTQGSIEAICESLKKFSTNEIIVKIISASIGNITETDSILALTSNATILGFNVKIDASVRCMVDFNRLDIRYYSVIYNLLDEVKKLVYSKLAQKNKYKVIGIAKVNNIFRSKKFGTIAGCVVTKGVMKIHKRIMVKRDNIIIYEGELESLRHFKNDVNEIKVGVECGIGIKNYNNICPGDIIELLDII